MRIRKKNKNDIQLSDEALSSLQQQQRQQQCPTQLQPVADFILSISEKSKVNSQQNVLQLSDDFLISKTFNPKKLNGLEVINGGI